MEALQEFLQILRVQLNSAQDKVCLADKAVVKSKDLLQEAEEKLSCYLDDSYACLLDDNDKIFKGLTEDRNYKKRVYYSKVQDRVGAINILESACERIKGYAIEVCVPEEFWKTAVALYITGNSTVDIYFGEGNNPNENNALYWFNIVTGKITHKHEMKKLLEQ